MVHHKYRILILSFDFGVGSVSRACVSLAGSEHALETRLPLRLFLEDRVIWIVWLLLLLVRFFFFKITFILF